MQLGNRGDPVEIVFWSALINSDGETPVAKRAAGYSSSAVADSG
jgi:hypothetical protein